MFGLPLIVILAMTATAITVGLGVYVVVTTITRAVARVWFKEKERHAKRIIQLSKED